MKVAGKGKGKGDKGRSKSEEQGRASERKHKEPQAAMADARFEKMQWDPRFQRFPKAKRHVEIDKRFEGMFKQPEFQQHSIVDKRGRKVAKRKNQDNMKKYYKLKDEDAWREDAKDAAEPNLLSMTDTVPKLADRADDKASGTAAQAESEESPSADQEGVGASSEDEESPQDLAQERWARARGLAGDSSSSEEEDDSAAPDDSEDEEALIQEWGIGAMAANPDEHIPEADETSRLAIVDLDWGKISAVDVLAVLRSFLVKGQSIKAVSVYPSDFGLQKMMEEASVGPQSIFGRGTAGNAKAVAQTALPVGVANGLSDSDGEESDLDNPDAAHVANGSTDEEDSDMVDELVQDAAQQESSDDSGEDVNQRRLQLYERSRLRYYYAVVECQDVATAAHLYTECDGMEFLRSACKLDMRFVPDEQSFAERQLRDAASSVPADYAPPDFSTNALQHTNVKLTWDADDDNRKKALRKKMTEESIRDDDFKAYLASSSSEEEEGQEDATALRERYRALLLGGEGGEDARTGGRKGQAWTSTAPGQDDSESDGQEPQEKPVRQKKKDAGMDMEVTFVPGLKGLGARLLAQKQDASKRKGDTVWEAYLRRQKEKKLAAKAQGRRGGSSDEDESDGGEAEDGSEQGSGDEQDPFFQHDEDPFSDPFFKDNEADKQATIGSNGKATKANSKHALSSNADGKANKAAEQQKQAQLEMLMMDDSALQDAAKIGGKLQTLPEEDEDDRSVRKLKTKVSRKERLQRKQDQKRAEREAGSDDDDISKGTAFKANLQDPRFKSLFSSADFALDPTDPRFKQLDGSKAIAQQQAQGIAPGLASTQANRQATDGQTAGSIDVKEVSHPANGDVQLKSMVASLKRKAHKESKRLVASAAAEQPLHGEKKKKRRLIAHT